MSKLTIQDLPDLIAKGEGGLYKCPKSDPKPLLHYWVDPITCKKTKVLDYGDN